MKVVLALGWYFPESSGGTEVYVSELARALKRSGVEPIVAAPAGSSGPAHYEHAGIRVHRYPLARDPDRSEASGDRPPTTMSEFARWLEREKPDIYHQHSWTRGCGVHHLAAARGLGLRTVTTIHVPAPICLRETMLLDGRSECDGWIDTRRCTRCWGASRGIPAVMADLIGRAPRLAVGAAMLLPAGSRLRTGLRTPQLVDAHRHRFDRLVELSDRLIVVCDWLRNAALRNNADPLRLLLCRQGVAEDAASWPEPPVRTGALRLGYLGRLDPVKGLDLLVKAVASVPASTPVELVIHGLLQDEAYGQYLRRLASADGRVRFAPPATRESLRGVLQSFDVLAIPSRWLETGPLVALEARAAGIPVLASRRGGLAEIVEDGVHGWLVPPDDMDAWSAAVRELAADPARARALRGRRGPVRRMTDVCTEMLAVYSSLLREGAGTCGVGRAAVSG
ncbi:MAG TPA: glycosyltransferase [Vicinamibacterales bacterium]